MLGIAWPNHLAAFVICAAVITELASLGGIGTDTGCAGCRWVEVSI